MPIPLPASFLHSEFLIFQIFICYLQGMRNSCIWKGSFGYSCYRQDTKNVHVPKICCLRSSAHMDGDYKLEADSWISSSKLTYLVDHYSHRTTSFSSGGNNVTAHARNVLPAVSLHTVVQRRWSSLNRELWTWMSILTDQGSIGFYLETWWCWTW